MILSELSELRPIAVLALCLLHSPPWTAKLVCKALGQDLAVIEEVCQSRCNSAGAEDAGFSPCRGSDEAMDTGEPEFIDLQEVERLLEGGPESEESFSDMLQDFLSMKPTEARFHMG